MDTCKRISLIFIIISSLCVVLCQSLMLLEIDFPYKELNGISFIGLGIGSILYGICVLKSKKT